MGEWMNGWMDGREAGWVGATHQWPLTGKLPAEMRPCNVQLSGHEVAVDARATQSQEA